MASINVGDVIFQLFMLGIPVLIVVAIVYFIRSWKKQKEQLQRLEDKIDQLENKSK
ncbi:DUF4083 family protein [Bacillus sp. REN10]|uniref:DUF4083 family protein n=1 Tax=Bacillus sp. REN10 TaxID=2782541 RepID=UPI001EEE1643|nr:DUF4083 family protein [Bacillus sp. REN10]